MKKSTTPRPAARPRYPHRLLAAGVVVLVIGGILMLWNFGYLPELGRLWPIPVILVGLAFLYMTWPRGHSDRWLIPGMVFTLGGIVFLLVNTVLNEQSLVRIWPAFMLVTGISLIPYGFRRKGSARIAIVVPGIFICCLALIFLPFSLRLVEGGFSAFAQRWWPVILILVGIALIVSFFSTRRPSSKV